jgi:hypothetical protein
VEATAAGPLQVALPASGLHLAVSWDDAATSADAWPFGDRGIRRFAADVERLAVTPVSGSSALFSRLNVQEAHLLVSPARAVEGMEVELIADGIGLTQGDGSTLPPISLRVQAAAVGAGEVLQEDFREQLYGWVARGGEINLAEFSMSSGDVRFTGAGTLTLSSAGLLSGTLNLRIAGLQNLPGLVEEILPGSRERADQMVAVLTAFTREAEVGGETVREVQAAIVDGAVSIGIIPIGTIPPLLPSAQGLS